MLLRAMAGTILAGCLFAPAALAQEAQEPPFAASRPGQTEGPIAVPKGYLQLETEIASYARNHQSGVKSDAYSLGASALRYGLGSGYDAELIVSPLLHQSTRSGGVKTTDEGFGDVTLRLLKTLSGEDGDGPALAVIGYVTLPTASNGLGADRTEGGAIVTGSFPIANTWGAAWTLGAAARYRGAGDYQAEFSGAAQLNHAFTDTIGGYVELAAVRAEHNTRTAANFDFGAALAVGKTTQLDAGVNLGITRTADDANVFVGWAHRF